MIRTHGIGIKPSEQQQQDLISNKANHWPAAARNISNPDILYVK